MPAPVYRYRNMYTCYSELLNVPTLLIGTRSVRTAGVSVTSPPDAPPPLPFAPSAPSITPVRCTDAPTPPALEMATLRLLLAVVLPRPRTAPIAVAPTLRLTGILTHVRLLPLSGVPLLLKRSFSGPPLATKCTRPPTTDSSRPPLHPPAPSSRRSRWLLREPEGQRYFRPLEGRHQAPVSSLTWSPRAPPLCAQLHWAWPNNAVPPLLLGWWAGLAPPSETLHTHSTQ